MKINALRRRRPKSMSQSDESQVASSGHPKAVLRTLDILEIVPESGAGLSMAEICEKMALPLHSRGYLEQDEEGRYRLAPKIRLGRIYERSDRMKSTARLQLQALVGHFEETASLAFLFDDCVRVIDTVESFHDFRVNNKVGHILPPYASSLAKAIVAFQSPQKFAQIIEIYGLNRRTAKTKLDRRLIYAEFEEIRTCGYAADREEALEGAICLAAPIFSPSGKVEASLSIATPVVRFTADREGQMLSALSQAAREIAASLQSNDRP
jgi:DNA-binding IclR family transcriptional regulator